MGLTTCAQKLNAEKNMCAYTKKEKLSNKVMNISTLCVQQDMKILKEKILTDHVSIVQAIADFLFSKIASNNLGVKSWVL